MIRPYGTHSRETRAAPRAPFSPMSRRPVPRRVHRQGDRARRALRADLRRLDGLPRAARRPDGQRLDSDRRARHLGAQASRRLDHPREQHRPDDRVGRRVGRRGSGLHRAGAALLRRARAGLLQLLPDHHARLCRRHPRRPDDGAAAARAHRQGARRAAVSGRHRLRRRPRRRRARRRARQDRLPGLGVGALWKAVSWIVQIFPTGDRPLAQPHEHLPERDAQRRHLARVHGRRLRHRPAHRRRHVCRRRALLAGAPAAALDHGQLPHGTVSAGTGERAAHRSDVAQPALERLHPLHGRGRGAGAGPDHPGADDPDHRVVVPRQHERLLGQGNGRGACRARSATSR